MRSAKAKVALKLAKLCIAKQRYETMRDRYVDWQEAIDVGQREAVYVIEALRAAPAAYAQTLAEEMQITSEAAAEIFDQFIRLTLVEIGDLLKQAVRDAERA